MDTYIRSSACVGFWIAVILSIMMCINPAQGQPVNQGKNDLETYFSNPPKHSIPTEEEQKQTEAIINSLLADMVDSTEDFKSHANLYFNLGIETNDRPVKKYVLLNRARALALESGDYTLAYQAVIELEKWFTVDAISMQMECITNAMENNHSLVTEPELLRITLSTIDKATVADRYMLAKKLITSLLSSAESNDLDKLAARFTKQRTELDQIYDAYDEFQSAAVSLLYNPNNPQANETAGRFLCFAKNNWQRGIKYLSRGSNSELRDLAISETDNSTTAPVQVKIADAWKDITKDLEGVFKRNVFNRAEAWYRKAYPALSGFTRLEVDQRMESKALLTFDYRNAREQVWVDEHFKFWANHGKNGPGTWANYGTEQGLTQLVANRAGYVETLMTFPQDGYNPYRIDALITSDLAVGTGLQFAGIIMYFGGYGGIHIEGGWIPPITHTIIQGVVHHYEIDVAPDSISFTIDGEHVGTMERDETVYAPIMLRGWEGHVQCRRLAVWVLPEDN